MEHEIPKHVQNSDVVHLVNEYVRLERDRGILLDHWFGGLSIMALTGKYRVSDTTIKKVLYEIGDEIIAMASAKP